MKLEFLFSEIINVCEFSDAIPCCRVPMISLIYPFESRSTGFRRPVRYNPKLAPNVYRLIGAALIGVFFFLVALLLF